MKHVLPHFIMQMWFDHTLGSLTGGEQRGVGGCVWGCVWGGGDRRALGEGVGGVRFLDLPERHQLSNNKASSNPALEVTLAITRAYENCCQEPQQHCSPYCHPVPDPFLSTGP